ncbi:hypothetical protein COO60DRAFT_699211 [Scenedesmus sp. NREL 46B-D3]|nr:hypothetical protein COO60DRAFT_699211 [Scenedesmus sp. NREL 46B-D3]
MLLLPLLPVSCASAAFDGTCTLVSRLTGRGGFRLVSPQLNAEKLLVRQQALLLTCCSCLKNRCCCSLEQRRLRPRHQLTHCSYINIKPLISTAA